MILRPPKTTRTDTLFPSTTRVRSFSKGRGAPTGAVLAGPADVMERAWLLKHRFGGAMRQAGIVAAGCVHALDHHVDRLADDHANAADRKSTRLNSSHQCETRMPSSA